VLDCLILFLPNFDFRLQLVINNQCRKEIEELKEENAKQVSMSYISSHSRSTNKLGCFYVVSFVVTLVDDVYRQ